MPTIASPRFYVYILCRPNGKPFYVGKGSGDRIYQHEREARIGVRSHKCNVIRKIWRDGGEVQRYIMFQTDDEQEALAYERDLIALYGRDSLANQTDGGDSPTPSPRLAELYRQRMLRRWRDPESRDQLLRAGQNAEVVKRRTETRKRRWKDDPDYRARHAAGAKRAANRPETLERMSKRAQKEWADPVKRAKRMQGLQKAADRRKGKPFAVAQGERNKEAKLTELQVREIRIRRYAGESANQLAEVFGVLPATIRGIIRRTAWKHTDADIPIPQSIVDRVQPHVKLTKEQVILIRQQHAEGMSIQDLCLHFGVSPTTIRDLLSGKTWRDVK